MCLIEQSLCRLVVGGARPLLMVCAGTLDGCAVAVPDPGQGQWRSFQLRSALVKIAWLWVSAAAISALGIPWLLLKSS